ncbi:hypothetical protein Ahy_B05g075300 [Arachis hypogaea]|uniref:Pentatricopeptide repeat-containing protein n=1 Tax=Arachis hypogaea TaxID=3818 RepID=A0A444Z0Y7_ARAHY|nr:hypothetical protein Ahy_B05g075300 [Arachis hypogaea]
MYHSSVNSVSVGSENFGNAITSIPLIFGHLNLCRKNLVPSTVTYNTLIDDLGKSKRISRALELFIEMHDKGQPSSIFTYNFLIDALCKNQQLDKALVLFSKMEEIGLNQIYTHTAYLLMAYAKVENLNMLRRRNYHQNG